MPRFGPVPCQDLVVTMIRENVLSVVEADALKEAWANHHRFRLSIESFADVIRSLPAE